MSKYLQIFILGFILVLSFFFIVPSASADLLKKTQAQLCPLYNKKSSAPSAYHLRFIPGKTLFAFSPRRVSYEDNSLVRLQNRLCSANLLTDEEVLALLDRIQYATINSQSVTLRVQPRKMKVRSKLKIRKRIGAQNGARWQIAFKNHGKEGFIPVYQLAINNRLIRIIFNFSKANQRKACFSSMPRVRSLSWGSRKINQRIIRELPGCQRLLRSVYQKNPPWKTIPVS